MSRFGRALRMLGVGGVVAVVACGGEGDGAATFVTVLGTDTLQVETFRRVADRIEGRVIQRSPTMLEFRYAYHLNPDGSIARLEGENFRPAELGGDPERQTFTTELGDGVASITRVGGETAGSTEVEAGPGAVPISGRTPLFMVEAELAIERDAPNGLELVSPYQPRAADLGFESRGADTVSYSFFGSPMLAWDDGSGHIMGLSGRETTFKVEVERVASLDFDALSSTWSTLDAQGLGIGTPSPAGTAEAIVDGATLRVDYSRPAKRNREVWGGALVPHGEVWRTGANSAAQFTTDRPITIGDVELEVGAYTLWTTFEPGTATLIVNAQTNIWGTDYDETHDIGRTAMSISSLAAVSESFTISIEDTPQGGLLHLEWDQTRFSVPITVG